MSLISLQEITIAFGGPLLLDNINLNLEPGDRIGLIGRNGVGKTTLMKVLSGQLAANKGKIVYQKGIKVTKLPQEIPNDIKGNIFDIILSGLGERVKILSDYHHLLHRLETEHTPKLMRQLDRLQTEVDQARAWEINNQVEGVISQMKLDPESMFEHLSGGQKKRVLLAKALVPKPDILLLDEPTNHLDIESIDWLENFLKNYSGTLFFVTHDRTFMTHLATKIIELDRGKLFSWACDYKTFLKRKRLALDAEASERAEFAKKLAKEEVWIRQGIKARRTRNEGRVKALERMRQEKRAERQAIGQVRMKAQETNRSGQLVTKADHLTYSYGNINLIHDFSTQIMRGDKIGIIGPNGCGKTTLFKLLLEQIPIQKGTIRPGVNLEIAYYDQLREQLDENKTVKENVSGDSDVVMINNRPRHIIGYLQDFLFSPDRTRTPAKALSGGERNRLCLARLFTKSFNLLVMDEPTNDLDIETLELLEELLMDYSGTLLLVSHDRAFLDNVVTSTIVFEGHGLIKEYPGGYNDWLTMRSPRLLPIKAKIKSKKKSLNPKNQNTPVKLSRKENRELEELPEKIEKLESEKEENYKIFTDVNFYKKNAKEIAEAKDKIKSLGGTILEAYKRWNYLEDLKNN